MNVLVGGLVAVAVLLVSVRSTQGARRPVRTVDAAEAVPATDPRARHDRRVAAIAARSRRSRVRRSGVSPDAVVDWCDSIARRVRSGETLRAAVRHAVPNDQPLADATAEARVGLDRGQSLTAAMAGCAASSEIVGMRGRHHLGLACAAIAAAAELGGSSATALDRVGVTLRLRAADEQERVAYSAQARLSAHVLTFLPIGMIVVLAATDRAVRATISTPLGVSTLGLGMALNLAGWWWMRHIIGVAR